MTMDSDSVSALYAAVMDWAMTFGETDIGKQPGLWHRRTEKVGALGPLDVRINAHQETIDNVPPFNVRIGMDDYFPGLIALIGPFDGIVMRSPHDHENEDGLIAHFKAQPSLIREADSPSDVSEGVDP
jgi:hypothetical protein